MQRIGSALLLAIAVIAGFAARPIVAPSGLPGAPVSGSADTAIANDFYVALNDALAGGPIEPLAPLLSEIFRDHDSDTGETRSSEEFLDDLQKKGASPQGVRLEPISVEGVGETLVVGVELVQTGSLAVAGITVQPQLPGPHFETLRVVGGKIVDRWAPPVLWLEVTDARKPAIPVPTLTEVWATLMRVTVAGGTAFEWSTASTGILTIESGAGDWTASTAGPGEEPVHLQPGDVVAFPGGAQVQLRSVNGPVTALLFVAALVSSADVSHSSVILTEVAQGLTRTVLWSGPFSGVDSITRYRPASIVLPPNVTLELRHAQGIDALIAIDGGVLDLWSPDGTITLLGSDQWPKAYTGAAQLDANHAGAIVAPETVTVRNHSDRPIALFVIAIERATVAG